jgi:hypothetical protein
MKLISVFNATISYTSHSQEYWDLGRCPSYYIPETRKHDIRKLDLFTSSGEEGRKATIQLSPSEIANISHDQ